MHEEANLNPPMQTSDLSRTKRRNQALFIFWLMLCCVAGFAYFVWWKWFANYESTDNAYVNANVVIVTPQQHGRILAYRVDNTQYVAAGDLLIELDPTDYALAFERAKSELALAALQVQSLYEDVKQKNADLALQEIKYQRALLDVQNRTPLIHSEAISEEDMQHVKADLKISEALVQHAKYLLQAAKAALGTQEVWKHPTIENAKSKARDAYLALKRCRILAPTAGHIANRTVEIGQAVAASTALMNIIPLSTIWVDANYKETQLSRIRIGQAVKLTTDIYGKDVIYQGKVAGITPGTGSSFSLLPPQNASGNWIKVIQRVPVRITLDPEEIKSHPLLLGLSVFTTVDTQDETGELVSKSPAKEAWVSTNIFDISLDNVDAELDAIVTKNLNL